MPINDLSGNIKTEFIETIANRQGHVSTIYSPDNTFYLVSFPSNNLTYCFDLKGTTENGSYRVTRWPSSAFFSFEVLRSGQFLVGNTYGFSEYSGYSDNGASYRFRYYSPRLTFGDPSKLKILKKLRPTIVGANSATVFVNWAYDFDTSYRTQEYTVGNQTPAFYGVSEFTVGELTGGTLV